MLARWQAQYRSPLGRFGWLLSHCFAKDFSQCVWGGQFHKEREKEHLPMVQHVPGGTHKPGADLHFKRLN
jgi:hypothetical protein